MRSASNSRSRDAGSRFSSACRSRGRPDPAAREWRYSTAPAGSSSRWGQPPTTSAPAAIARSASALSPVDPGPVTGHERSIATWTSMIPAQSLFAAINASSDSSPFASVTSAWVRTVDTPFAAYILSARTARSCVSACVMDSRAASSATMAPMRSLVSLRTRSARNALSMCACGSTSIGRLMRASVPGDVTAPGMPAVLTRVGREPEAACAPSSPRGAGALPLPRGASARSSPRV